MPKPYKRVIKTHEQFLNSINALLEYTYQDECEDFHSPERKGDNLTNHIFQHIRALDEFLKVER